MQQLYLTMSDYPPNWPHSGYSAPNNAHSDPNGPPGKNNRIVSVAAVTIVCMEDPYRFNTAGTRQQGQSYNLIPSGQQQYYSVDQGTAYPPNQTYSGCSQTVIT